MFQNMTDSVDDNYIKNSKLKLVLKEMFKKNNIIIYILTFLVSSISIKSEIAPFGLAILAACMGTTIPVFMVCIISGISTLIFHGIDGFSSFFYIVLLFFLMNFMFKPKVSLEERNEILMVGGKVFWASFIYYFIKNITGVFLLYDLFMGIVISALIYIFYKIFVNGIAVIKDFKEKVAFSIEEIIAATLIVSIAVSTLKNVVIFDLSIANIIIIFMILVLGLKNGMLLGASAGVSIGLAMMLTGSGNILFLAVLAVSGVLAGFLNNFGKIGVIVGFVLGNAVITYLVTGNIVQVVYYREILISSIALLFVPVSFKIKIKEIMPKEKFLPNMADKRLDGYTEIKEKIDMVSQTIMSNIKEPSNEVLSTEKMREEFVQDFLDNFENYASNIFYEDVKENETLISEIYDTFIIEDILTEKIIIDIFKKHNNYILLRDEKIKNDLQELIKVMNQTFRTLQMKNIKNEVQNEQKMKMNNEMKNISKVINKVSQNIENRQSLTKKEKEIMILLKGKNYPVNNIRIREINNGKSIVTLNLDYNDETIREKGRIVNISDIISKSLGKRVSFQKDLKSDDTKQYNQIYATEDKFVMQVGSSKVAKENSEQSGDSSLQIKLKDGKYILAISDGMGSGPKARQASKTVINSLNTFLAEGFDEEETLNIINSNLNFNQENDMYASLDMSVLDLFTGKMTLVKNGSCNTYIKNKKNISVYKSENIPVGTVDNLNFTKEIVDLKEDDIIVMCSDGVLESKNEISNDWIEDFLKSLNTNNVQKIADLIVTEAIDNSYGIANDDITVIVAKILRRK